MFYLRKAYPSIKNSAKYYYNKGFLQIVVWFEMIEYPFNKTTKKRKMVLF